MSAILKGLLQPQILSVLQSYGTNEYIESEGTTGTAATAQIKFADRLASAISIAVQQYLLSNVTVNPGQAVVTNTGGGSTVSPGILNAP